MNNYEHIISLGFFCGTALEMEKIGLRSSSGPFDWLISDFKGVLDCIENGFQDFLNYNKMSQYKNIRKYYVDTKYNFHFYHDFSEFSILSEQLPNVQEKYKKRINRFFEEIKEPTLFIRYIENKKELQFIELNFDEIINLLKSFNKNNNIIFIKNDDIFSKSIDTFNVKKDEHDSVARNFLNKNIELQNFLNSNILENEKRRANLEIFSNKLNKQRGIRYNFNKVFLLFKRNLKKEYIHCNIYTIS